MKPRIGQGGNLMNRLGEAAKQPQPKIGMGATIMGYTDRTAATVVRVGSNRITVREDLAIRTDKNGQSDAQEYRYERNPHGSEYEFSRRANGSWVKVGDAMRNGLCIALGYREHYFDYGF